MATENGAKAKFNDYESDLNEANSANNIFINDLGSNNHIGQNANSSQAANHEESSRVVIDSQKSPATGDMRKIEYSQQDEEGEEGEATASSNEDEENSANENGDQDENDYE